MTQPGDPFDGEMEFHFEKSTAFRVIHVDGAFGGIAPNRHIHMAVYSERQPIPKRIVHTIAGGVLGPELLEKRETRSGIFREIEADLVLTKESALAVRDWLDQRIAEMIQTEAGLSGSD